MDNFEKKAISKFLIKLLPEVNYNDYDFDELLENILREYKLKKSEVKNIETLYPHSRITKAQQQQYYNDLIKKIKAKAEELPVIHTLFEKKLGYIKDLYSLDKNEFAVLEFQALVIRTELGEALFNCLDSRCFQKLYEKFLRLKKNNRKSFKNRLYQKGIIEDFDDCYITISAKISEVLKNEKINTLNKVKNALVGESEMSELKWKDFDCYDDERKTTLKILKSAVEKKSKGINILLYGDVGTGKTQFAKMIANKAKINQYQVSFQNDGKEESDRKDRISDLFSKQVILEKFHNSCILFDEAEDIFNRYYSSKAYLNNILENTPVPVFWTTNNIREVDPAVLRRMTYAVEFKKLSEENRLKVWNAVLKKNNFQVDKDKLIRLNNAYDISPSIINNAIKTTKLIDGTQEDFEQFIENVAKVVSKRPATEKKKEFEVNEYDISLINTDLNMKDLTEKIKKCGKLNFSLCLYGEPGTGKSLYAKYLAKQLGIETVQKRASDLVSKWVGQTEQNIAEAFAEAKAKSAMLIFDEADSFLQNRSNASYNWEVSQVNEMLTWMESHQYPFVCTTNLLDTLDEASLRRFTFKIKFDFMNNLQVNRAIEHFFNIKDARLNIKGLTAGDFATVKKKADFLNISDLSELEKMLYDEVKLKNSKDLKRAIGF